MVGKDLGRYLLDSRRIGNLHQSLFLHDRMGRFSGNGHFLENGLGDFAANHPGIHEFEAFRQMRSGNRGIGNALSGGFEQSEERTDDPVCGGFGFGKPFEACFKVFRQLAVGCQNSGIICRQPQTLHKSIFFVIGKFR